MKFRKKPVVIEAVQFSGSSSQAHEIEQWMKTGVCPTAGGTQTSDYTDMQIKTLEGVMTVDPGDWVIKGVKGEFYPCKPDIFAMTYDPI